MAYAKLCSMPVFLFSDDTPGVILLNKEKDLQKTSDYMHSITLKLCQSFYYSMIPPELDYQIRKKISSKLRTICIPLFSLYASYAIMPNFPFYQYYTQKSNAEVWITRLGQRISTKLRTICNTTTYDFDDFDDFMTLMTYDPYNIQVYKTNDSLCQIYQNYANYITLIQVYLAAGVGIPLLGLKRSALSFGTLYASALCHYTHSFNYKQGQLCYTL